MAPGKSLMDPYEGLYGWLSLIALLGLAGMAVISVGWATWARVTGRPDEFSRWMRNFMRTLALAFLVGLIPEVVNTFYHMLPTSLTNPSPPPPPTGVAPHP